MKRAGREVGSGRQVCPQAEGESRLQLRDVIQIGQTALGLNHRRCLLNMGRKERVDVPSSGPMAGCYLKLFPHNV